MANQNDPKKNNDPKSLKPDPKTLHKTDPQENMEGPVSSIMQKLAEDTDDNNESKKEADKKKNENM